MNDELSSLFEKLNIDKNSISPDMVNSLMSMLNNRSNSTSVEKLNNFSNGENEASGSQNNIDFETILKMKSIIDKLNIKDDPRSKLLESLKPYLKESRKDKINQYVQLMNMSKVMESFNSLNNGDNKNVFK